MDEEFFFNLEQTFIFYSAFLLCWCPCFQSVCTNSDGKISDERVLRFPRPMTCYQLPSCLLCDMSRLKNFSKRPHLIGLDDHTIGTMFVDHFFCNLWIGHREVISNDERPIPKLCGNTMKCGKVILSKRVFDTLQMEFLHKIFVYRKQFLRRVGCSLENIFSVMKKL